MNISAYTVRANVSVPIGPHADPGRFITFSGIEDGKDHFALYFEQSNYSRPPLVRMHSECITGDLFFSRRCDCGYQLQDALELLRKEGGYLLYLRQEGRGIGLGAKMEAYALQEKGLDTFEANAQLGLPEDSRDFNIASEMLKALGVQEIRLLTNNPEKVAALKANGISIQEVIATKIHCNKYNRFYLETKRNKAGHNILPSRYVCEAETKIHHASM
ncbi:GTP cyclohydrolase II [Agrobacterium radiobacter]|uniref:GTP cyclohydrolase II n=1 Tax=Agrobacterium radiobacter TaxID=362 RepID=UPI003F87A5F5